MVTLTSPNTFYIYLAAVIGTALVSTLLNYFFTDWCWYDSLDKPCIADCKYVFSLVWTTLFILLVVAGYYGDIAAKAKRDNRFVNAVRILFGLQLLFIVLWVLAFFVMQQLFLALVANIILFGLIIALMVMYIQVEVLSFWVLVPYVVWVGFAMLITWYVWRNNRSGCGCGCNCGDSCTCGCNMGLQCMC